MTAINKHERGRQNHHRRQNQHKGVNHPACKDKRGRALEICQACSSNGYVPAKG